MVIAIPFINGYIERSKKDAFDVSAGASEQTSVVGFKDSLSNSIYGNSTTVTPNNFSVVFYIKY